LFVSLRWPLFGGSLNSTRIYTILARLNQNYICGFVTQAICQDLLSLSQSAIPPLGPNPDLDAAPHDSCLSFLSRTKLSFLSGPPSNRRLSANLTISWDPDEPPLTRLRQFKQKKAILQICFCFEVI